MKPAGSESEFERRNGHLVRQIGALVFEVISGTSGTLYMVGLGRDGGTSCPCEHRRHGADWCSHSVAVEWYLEARGPGGTELFGEDEAA